jgi:hypothetical protein
VRIGELLGRKCRTEYQLFFKNQLTEIQARLQHQKNGYRNRRFISQRAADAHGEIEPRMREKIGIVHL